MSVRFTVHGPDAGSIPLQRELHQPVGAAVECRYCWVLPVVCRGTLQRFPLLSPPRYQEHVAEPLRQPLLHARIIAPSRRVRGAYQGSHLCLRESGRSKSTSHIVHVVIVALIDH